MGLGGTGRILMLENTSFGVRAAAVEHCLQSVGSRTRKGGISSLQEHYSLKIEVFELQCCGGCSQADDKSFQTKRAASDVEEQLPPEILP